jgi:hypothetical protein
MDSWNQGDSKPFEEDDESTLSTSNKEDEDSTSLLQVDNENPSNEYLFELILFILIPILAFFSLVLIVICFALLLYRVKFLLVKLKLANRDYITELDPFQICFSQANISPYFQNGDSLENTIKELVKNKLRIEDIPIIHVCIINDIYYSSDNRRLYCFQEAIKKGLQVKKIPVKIRRVSDCNIIWKLEGSYKIVRNNNFKKIVVSPFAKNSRVIDNNGYWEYFE